jgi:hypothetical protein
MNPPSNTDHDKMTRALGILVQNCAVIELLLVSWLQEISTDRELVALLLSQRVLSVGRTREMIAACVDSRAPDIANETRAALELAKQASQVRNVVCHNPVFLREDLSEGSWLRMDKSDATPTTLEDVKAAATKSLEASKRLHQLYVKQFGREPRLDDEF